MRELNKETKRMIFVESLIIVFSILLYLFIKSTYIELIPECAILKNTGIMCLSCGGTRCIANICSFKILEAFKSHAVIFITIIYLNILNIVYMINTLKKKRILKCIYLKVSYLFIWIGVLVGYTIIRNII